jgi:hypothetical protein
MTEYAINLLILAGTNLFWLFALSWEMTFYSRPKDYKPKWYEKELF